MRILFASISLLLSSVTISAQVTLPRVLSSHMVIQRDLPVHVWGNAAPGQPVPSPSATNRVALKPISWVTGASI